MNQNDFLKMIIVIELKFYTPKVDWKTLSSINLKLIVLPKDNVVSLGLSNASLFKMPLIHGNI